MEDPASLAAFLATLRYAAEKHEYQRRSGYAELPYVNHLIKVAYTLVHIGGETDRVLLAAALLHDVVEDTNTTQADLADRFGADVADIVLELTDDMRLPGDERKRLQIERAPNLSAAARKIRIADKACNILDIQAYPVDWTPERKLAYVRTAEAVVDRIRGTHPALESWFDEVADAARVELEEAVARSGRSE